MTLTPGTPIRIVTDEEPFTGKVLADTGQAFVACEIERDGKRVLTGVPRNEIEVEGDV